MVLVFSLIYIFLGQIPSYLRLAYMLWVAQTGLKLLILQPLPPQCLDYRCIPPCLVQGQSLKGTSSMSVWTIEGIYLHRLWIYLIMLVELLFPFLFLRQGLTILHRLALKSWSSCLSLLNVGITGMYYHTQSILFFSQLINPWFKKRIHRPPWKTIIN
jgi:hypothetical protein